MTHHFAHIFMLQLMITVCWIVFTKQIYIKSMNFIDYFKLIYVLMFNLLVISVIIFS